MADIKSNDHIIAEDLKTNNPPSKVTVGPSKPDSIFTGLKQSFKEALDPNEDEKDGTANARRMQLSKAKNDNKP